MKEIHLQPCWGWCFTDSAFHQVAVAVSICLLWMFLKSWENLSFPSCCHKNPCFGGTTFLIQKKSMSFLMNKRNGFLIEKGDSCPDLNRNFIAGFSHQQLFAEKLWICAFWYGGCWKITTSPRCLRRLWETGVSCGNAFFQRPWFLSWKQHPTKAFTP